MSRPSINLRLAIGVLYAASGFSTLALETLWLREVALVAGSTAVAAALVIAAFFFGAAGGSLLGAHLASRIRRTLLPYAWFEMSAAAAAITTFLLHRWLWTTGALPFSAQVSATVLLVALPSFLVGVTFPLLAEAFIEKPDERTSTGGVFYGLNLLGASVGVAAGGVVLPWYLGIANAFVAAACVQGIAGAFALCLAVGVKGVRPVARSGVEKSRTKLTWKLLAACALLTASGFLSLATQGLLMTWARQITQGSIYTVCSVLGVFIGGIGIGALLVAYLRRKGVVSWKLLAWLGLSAALLLFLIPSLSEWLVKQNVQLVGTTPLEMLAYSAWWSTLLLLPLTICIGAIFPLAWEFLHAVSPHHGAALGYALALNKVGSALGMLASAFLLLPLLGLRPATCALGWGYGILTLAVITAKAQWRIKSIWTALALLTGVVGVWQTTISKQSMGLAPYEREIASYHGSYGLVSVVENEETGSHGLLLNSNQRLNGTAHALQSQIHQGMVPLLFARQCDRVVTIGMASGISSAAVLNFPVKELYAMELVPQVVQAARVHFAPWNAKLFSDPRARVMIGDGRVLLEQVPAPIDVIICDLLFPGEDNTANLYSRDFFAHAKARLTPQGVFCLWLPCYQHDALTSETVIRTFLEVFPNAMMVRANLDPIQPVIGLMGSTEPIPISRAFLKAELARYFGDNKTRPSFYFQSVENIWLLLAGDLHAADPGFGKEPISTDDKPYFSYLGPRSLGERGLVGMTFLNWMGKRFLTPSYPSCVLDDTRPEEILASIRSANFYFASSIANSVIPGDKRPENVRLTRTAELIQKARDLNPTVSLPLEELGR